jgi:hypothetical protein
MGLFEAWILLKKREVFEGSAADDDSRRLLDAGNRDSESDVPCRFYGGE